MALPIADRVKDATTTTGTVNITLSNTAPAGYQTFLQGFGASTSKQICYCISNPNSPYEWETGFGGYTSSTNTLTRAVVTATSVAGSTVKINFPAGTKDVFCTTPSKSMLVQNGSGTIDIPNITNSGSITIAPELAPAGYAATGMAIFCPAPTLAAQNGTYLDMAAGASSTTGNGGYVSLTAGDAVGSGLGGDLYLHAGSSSTGSAGNVELFAGGSGTTVGGNISIIAGDGLTVAGNINLTAGGVSASGAGSGGNISIDSGGASGAGSNGSIALTLAGVSAITIQPADATTTAAAKIGLFTATPVVRPTTANTTAGTFVVSSGTALNVNSTYAGGSGNTYTFGQVVTALVKLGILT